MSSRPPIDELSTKKFFKKMVTSPSIRNTKAFQKFINLNKQKDLIMRWIFSRICINIYVTFLKDGICFRWCVLLGRRWWGILFLQANLSNNLLTKVAILGLLIIFHWIRRPVHLLIPWLWSLSPRHIYAQSAYGAVSWLSPLHLISFYFFSFPSQYQICYP